MSIVRIITLGVLVFVSITRIDANDGEFTDKSISFGQVIHIKNEAEFYALVSQYNVVVDCYAPWCGPCKILAPIFESVSKEYNTIVFVKIDIDKFPALRDRLSIQTVPTILCFKKSKTPCKRISKVLSKPDLRTMINQCFA